eukprot:CAMPEP_0172932512 /NCGR_PEP_ID=MMETSP1075-20121228/220035_1 /TAXON_ID=2916 /ORGANISM="Ceratium fusus, Strain PA161109" /LENGTH=599 /DNA_ID=CAMNT_0013793839 /DNA_START=43 /DNA_END=1839 /DNA_ORIENTATION=-
MIFHMALLFAWKAAAHDGCPTKALSMVQTRKAVSKTHVSEGGGLLHKAEAWAHSLFVQHSSRSAQFQYANETAAQVLQAVRDKEKTLLLEIKTLNVTSPAPNLTAHHENRSSHYRQKFLDANATQCRACGNAEEALITATGAALTAHTTAQTAAAFLSLATKNYAIAALGFGDADNEYTQVANQLCPITLIYNAAESAFDSIASAAQDLKQKALIAQQHKAWEMANKDPVPNHIDFNAAESAFASIASAAQDLKQKALIAQQHKAWEMANKTVMDTAQAQYDAAAAKATAAEQPIAAKKATAAAACASIVASAQATLEPTPMVKPCPQAVSSLSDFSSHKAMTSGGWTFNGINDGIQYGANFKGWAGGHPWGSMEATLKGVGVLHVTLENEHSNTKTQKNFVRLLKNGAEIEKLGSKEEKTINVPFVQGDKIKIDEHFGIIILKQFTATCYAPAPPRSCSAVTRSTSAALKGPNVAVASEGGVPFGSGSLAGYCSTTAAGEGKDFVANGIHCWKNINDGKLGNSYSWIPGHSGAFVGVRFAKRELIEGLRISRKGTGSCCNDRISGSYEVQYTTVENANHLTAAALWVSLGTFSRQGFG